MADSLLGAELGLYEITELIGKGGMATVYRGRQKTVNRLVAIKILPRNFTHDDTFMRRFRQEGEIVANLEHLHILPIYDFGEFDSMPYIVMRLLEGGSVKDRLRKGPLPWQEVVRLTSQVASALDYAHAAGIIHRDVKPNNILLDAHDNAYLSDFGLAKIIEHGMSGEISGTGSMVGTPAYMAPEMLSGGKPGPRIDVYGLAVSAFEMITGQIPFPADTPIAQLLAHTQRPVPSLKRFNPEMPPAVDEVMQKAMAKFPSQRYQSAGEFASELARVANEAGGWSWSDEALAALPRLRDELAAEITVVSPDPAHTLPLEDSPLPGVAPVPVVEPRPSRTRLKLLISIVTIAALLAALRFSPAWESEIEPLANRIVDQTRSLVGRGSATATPAQAAGRQPTDVEAASTDTPSPTEAPTLTATAPAATPTATRTPRATTSPAPTQFPATIAQGTATLLLVPAGAFPMGSRLGSSDEQPVHDVEMDAFYIDQREVTMGEYIACVEARRCTAPEVTRSRTRSGYYGVEEFYDYPILNVEWSDAFAYCRWRGAHLPTEAQWEKAAGWDPDSGEMRRFPWGTDELSGTLLNFGGTGLGDSTRVGRYPDGASPVGALDMAGNVAEWVWDWYQATYYEISPFVNPTGPLDGTEKVYRGGSFTDFGSALTTSARSAAPPATHLATVGFRCAWTPSGDPTAEDSE